MPISKAGKPYYTKEQYEAARYNGNALEYARSQGYELVRQGAYFTLKEHDSMVFTPNGRWFWNSRGVHGGAVEFMMYYENRTLAEAVLTLAGEREPARRQSAAQAPAPSAPGEPEPPAAVFRLPRKAANYRFLWDYLCARRGIDREVLREMIRQNRVYQSVANRQDGKPVCNATFVYLDPQRNPVGAYQRGMLDIAGQAPYKRDVPGSDKRFGWLLESPFRPATEVRVFEAAIDAASSASLDAMSAPDAWKQMPVDRLSLEGLSSQPLRNYLQTHPDVRQVTFMLDADEPGRRAANETAQRLLDGGFQGKIEIKYPPFGKDWNDVLTATRAMEAEAREPAPAQPATESPEP